MTKDELIDDLQLKNIQLTKALEVAENKFKNIIELSEHSDDCSSNFLIDDEDTIENTCDCHIAESKEALEQINRIKKEE